MKYMFPMISIGITSCRSDWRLAIGYGTRHSPAWEPSNDGNPEPNSNSNTRYRRWFRSGRSFSSTALAFSQQIVFACNPELRLSPSNCLNTHKRNGCLLRFCRTFLEDSL